MVGRAQTAPVTMTTTGRDMFTDERTPGCGNELWEQDHRVVFWKTVGQERDLSGLNRHIVLENCETLFQSLPSSSIFLSKLS